MGRRHAVHRAALRKGEVALIHGASGGVGLAAVQLAKHLGARVIATVGSADKGTLARAAGADEVIDFRAEDVGARMLALTGGRGADRILEPFFAKNAALYPQMLGKGGTYRSFDKVLEIPGGYFADFADWSRLALMRNRKTLAELEKLRRTATDPEAIGRMIAVIEEEEGYHLYDAVGRLKRALSAAEAAEFRFEGAGLNIAAEVRRADFEAWIAPDVARIDAAVDQALVAAGVAAEGIDRVFLTGGTSLTPRIRRLFAERFGEERLATGGELTSIAHGLALIGQQADVGVWAV